MPHRIVVRPAAVDDVGAMHALLAPLARDGIILPRDKDDLYQHLQEFLVADLDGGIIGVVALHIYEPMLAEIRSLVVAPEHRKHGVGALLVRACEQWAASLGVKRIFALTYVAGFFAKQGYQIVLKESLPHKIWTVCVHCPRFSHCDEIAVQKQLNAAPHLAPILEVEKE